MDAGLVPGKADRLAFRDRLNSLAGDAKREPLLGRQVLYFREPLLDRAVASHFPSCAPWRW